MKKDYYSPIVEETHWQGFSSICIGSDEYNDPEKTPDNPFGGGAPRRL